MSITLIQTNMTDLFDPFGGVQSPIDCWKLQVIATLLVLMCFFSVFINSLVVFTFYVSPELRTPGNMFVIAMTFINLLGSLSEFSYVIVSNYSCRYKFQL